MKRNGIAAVIWLLASALGAIGEDAEKHSIGTRFFGTFERFEWKEFGEDGARLLKESGSLYGIGAEQGIPLVHDVLLDVRGRIFFGDVDYDGSIQTPIGDEPYESSTSYTGYEVEGLLGYLLAPHDRLDVKPYAGVGWRYWQRTLDADMSDDAIGPWGYVEYWDMAYWLAGIEGSFKIGSKGAIICRLEGRRPYDISEMVDLSNAGQPSDVSVEPGKRSYFKGEIGYTTSPFLVALFAEMQTFRASALDNKYGVFSQPKSESMIWGLKLGLAF